MSDKSDLLKKLVGNKSIAKMAKRAYFQDEPDDIVYVAPSLDTEYGILRFYDERASMTTVSKTFRLVSHAIEEKQWSLLNLEETQNVIEQHFKYLNVLKRFNILQSTSGNELYYDHDGFHLHEFVFSTLDEVEKALRQKAFL